jgi:membrane protease subunit HflC
MKVLIVIAVVAIIGLIVLRQALFIVDETEQVIVTRFGEVQNIVTAPGLNVKAPFLDQLQRLDKRILRIDAPTASLPDRDKQNLRIDLYARYHITDPVQFRRTLQSEINARSRLGDIVVSTLRDQVALRNRFEIIGAQPVLDEAGAIVVDEEGLPLVEAQETRTAMLDEVLARVKRRVSPEELNFGIEMVDVRIKRADFPESVTPSIYTRMRAERNRIATRFRAEGDEQNLRIRAVANRDRDIILAQADRDSSRIRGEGEAEAIRILAEALNQDPDFFAFRRSLEAYQNFLSQQDTIVISADAPLFQFLGSPGSSSQDIQQASGEGRPPAGSPAAAEPPEPPADGEEPAP